MRKPAIAMALALLSTAFSTQVYAQSFSEPAAYASQHPDRDVLNGGALTPEARAAAGLENARGAFAAAGGTASVSAHRTHDRPRRHR
jgi:murein tripeptide amidase MpaA